MTADDLLRLSLSGKPCALNVAANRGTDAGMHVGGGGGLLERLSLGDRILVLNDVSHRRRLHLKT